MKIHLKVILWTIEASHHYLGTFRIGNYLQLLLMVLCNQVFIIIYSDNGSPIGPHQYLTLFVYSSSLLLTEIILSPI